jgi:hypothetical protein
VLVLVLVLVLLLVWVPLPPLLLLLLLLLPQRFQKLLGCKQVGGGSSGRSSGSLHRCHWGRLRRRRCGGSPGTLRGGGRCGRGVSAIAARAAGAAGAALAALAAHLAAPPSSAAARLVGQRLDVGVAPAALLAESPVVAVDVVNVKVVWAELDAAAGGVLLPRERLEALRQRARPLAAAAAVAQLLQQPAGQLQLGCEAIHLHSKQSKGGYASALTPHAVLRVVPAPHRTHPADSTPPTPARHTNH